MPNFQILDSIFFLRLRAIHDIIWQVPVEIINIEQTDMISLDSSLEMLFIIVHHFFFLEHAGELRINILRRKKGETPIHQSKVLL
jgi:hypothetical protein